MYTAATEIYTYWHTLSLPAALPIFLVAGVSDSVRLYRNNGNMTFTASTATSFGPASGSGPDGWQSAKPRADVADFDNDGRMDIIKTQFPRNSGLWRNTVATEGNRRTNVRVLGGSGNRDGVGPRDRGYSPGTNQPW